MSNSSAFPQKNDSTLENGHQNNRLNSGIPNQKDGPENLDTHNNYCCTSCTTGNFFKGRGLFTPGNSGQSQRRTRCFWLCDKFVDEFVFRKILFHIESKDDFYTSKVRNINCYLLLNYGTN